MRSKIFTIITILAIIIFAGLVYQTSHDIDGEYGKVTSIFDSQEKALQQQVLEYKEYVENAQRQQKIYHVFAGGDVMLDRGVETQVENNGKGDWKFPWLDIADDFNNADYVFINLEGSISNVGADTGKKFSFRFKPDVVVGLRHAGVDVVSLANNHIFDWGRESLCETTRILAESNIAFVGAGCDKSQADRPHIVNFGDTSVAFIAYTSFYQGAHATDARAGITEYDRNVMKQQIKNLKEQGIDIVMLSMHWGEEYKTRSNNQQQDLAHDLIDAGLDVLIGHHPHVVQEIERYSDGWIIYSLGNLIFDQYFSEETMRGMVADIQIQNGRVFSINPLNVQINEFYQPSIVEEF